MVKIMKFGLLTAICDGMTFEEVVDFAAKNHLECLEVACYRRQGQRDVMRASVILMRQI